VNKIGAPNPDFARLEAFTHLQTIFIGGGTFREADFAHLSTLKRLQTLYIDCTDVPDAALVQLKTLPSLKEAGLVFGSPHNDSCLDALSQLSRLETLTLGGIRISRTGAAQLKKLTHLRKLVIEGSQVDDQTIELIAAIGQLENLELVSTEVTPAGLVHLSALPNLRSLTLGKTIDAQWVSALKQLPSLKELTVTGMFDPTPSETQWLSQQLPNIRVTFQIFPSGSGPLRRIPPVIPSS
jgi:Leucine-rich repeat (LRR) protein